jgi:hypothetical protein
MLSQETGILIGLIILSSTTLTEKAISEIIISLFLSNRPKMASYSITNINKLKIKPDYINLI